MTSGVVAAIIALGLVASAAPGPADAQDTREVWQWFAPCSGNRVARVEVLFLGKPVYEASFPACSLPAAQIPPEPTRKILVFKFRARPSRFGEQFADLGVQDVEGNIWRAGGESEGLSLGVSFMAPRQVLLNTLHIALADQRSKTALADGLVIVTSAVHESEEPPSR